MDGLTNCGMYSAFAIFVGKTTVVYELFEIYFQF